MPVMAGATSRSLLNPINDVGGSGHPATATQMLAVLPFGIYPRGGICMGRNSSARGNGVYEPASGVTSTMPIFDTLDAAGWHPITGA